MVYTEAIPVIRVTLLNEALPETTKKRPAQLRGSVIMEIWKRAFP